MKYSRAIAPAPAPAIPHARHIEDQTAPIFNAAYWVRHYARPAKEISRRASLLALAAEMRKALNSAKTEDTAAILGAIARALDGIEF